MQVNAATWHENVRVKFVANVKLKYNLNNLHFQVSVVYEALLTALHDYSHKQCTGCMKKGAFRNQLLLNLNA